MPLMDAPAYDERGENLKKSILIGSLITFAVLVVLTLAGFISGHGWLFMNLPVEHKVNRFYNALEAKDYPQAYAIYTSGQKTDYSLQRFTEDWTTDSPVGAPITSHHVDISKTTGTGNFGSGTIVAATLNGSKKYFLYVNRKDGTLTESPLELQY